MTILFRWNCYYHETLNKWDKEVSISSVGLSIVIAIIVIMGNMTMPAIAIMTMILAFIVVAKTNMVKSGIMMVETILLTMTVVAPVM